MHPAWRGLPHPPHPRSHRCRDRARMMRLITSSSTYTGTSAWHRERDSVTGSGIDLHLLAIHAERNLGVKGVVAQSGHGHRRTSAPSCSIVALSRSCARGRATSTSCSSIVIGAGLDGLIVIGQERVASASFNTTTDVATSTHPHTIMFTRPSSVCLLWPGILVGSTHLPTVRQSYHAGQGREGRGRADGSKEQGTKENHGGSGEPSRGTEHMENYRNLRVLCASVVIFKFSLPSRCPTRQRRSSTPQRSQPR